MKKMGYRKAKATKKKILEDHGINSLRLRNHLSLRRLHLSLTEAAHFS
jgi:hypothetical protein